MTNYLWNTGATSQTIWAKSGGAYSVLASAQSCDFADTVIVGYLVQPIVKLGVDTSLCTGQSIVFDAGFCAGCTYQWSNLATGQMNIGATQTYTANAAGIYMAAVTGPNGCTGRDTVTLAVGEPLTISVSITASGNSVCQDSTASFVASPVNPGALPVYQWKVNGINSGGNSPAFSYTPVNGDQVSCVMTSSLASCIATNQATSNIIQMMVIPIAQVGIAITTTNSSVCLGETASFTATAVNAGNNPFYEWQVNGNNLGPNSPTFSYQPANGDVVSCRVNSSATCVTGSPAMSNAIAMTVSVGLPASVSIAANPVSFCEGSSVTFLATATNGGANPIYQWKVNGQNQGSNAATYSYVPQPGDSVRCVMTSTLACVSGNPAGSQSIILNPAPKPGVTFSTCFDTITTLNAQPFLLKGGLPPGGTFSGPGVNSTTGIFNPAIAGIGVKTISYAYQNIYTCNDLKTKSIRVLPTPNFTCGGTFTDPRDNKAYPTVQIGPQCWMQTNLEYGTAIQATLSQTDNCIPEKYLTLNSLHLTLYQWDELMGYNSTPGSQGLCPPGWHVPTEAEWMILFNFYQGQSRAGKPMQDMFSGGFSALLSGVFYSQHLFRFEDFGTFFWSSTLFDSTKAISHGLNSYNYSVSFYPSSKENAFAVRCLRD